MLNSLTHHRQFHLRRLGFIFACATALAEESGATLIPFLLDGGGGHPELNLRDGIHPIVEGHAVIAETVWKFLRPLL